MINYFVYVATSLHVQRLLCHPAIIIITYDLQFPAVLVISNYNNYYLVSKANPPI